MKQEELFKTLIRQLFSLNELHREYQDNDMSYTIDSKKKGDTLTISVTLLENKDKKEFEKWVDTIPDDIFQEAWESLAEDTDLHSLNEIYESENYKEVITEFKKKVKASIDERIKAYITLLS